MLAHQLGECFHLTVEVFFSCSQTLVVVNLLAKLLYLDDNYAAGSTETEIF